MIRFTLAGTPIQIKAWRLAVWLVWFGALCVMFDSFVCSWWADVPVEFGFAALIEWVFPAFGLYPMLGAAVEGLRGTRRPRTEQESGE